MVSPNVHPSVPIHAVRVSFEQLALMLAGGINVAEALAVLVRTNEQNGSLATAFESVVKDLEAGHPLSYGLRRFPFIFPTTLTKLMVVGEQSGRLVATITLGNQWMKRQEDLSRKVKKAFSYPILVIVVAVIVNLLVLKFCLPQMRDMIAGFGGTQPLLTRVVFSAGEIFVHPLSFVVLMALGISLWWKRNAIMKNHGYKIFSVLHELPMIGSMMRCAALARICSTLATCLEVNLTFLHALTLSLSASGDPVYEKSGSAIARNIKDGLPLAEALLFFPNLYPGLVWQSIQVGEESGRMPTALRSAAQLLGEELDYRIDVLTNFLEPFVLGICAFFVGLFVLAIFLPMQGFLAQLMS